MYFTSTIVEFFKSQLKGGTKVSATFKGELFYKGATKFSEDLRDKKATRDIHHFKGRPKNQADTMTSLIHTKISKEKLEN